jgi:hypothetical protein
MMRRIVPFVLAGGLVVAACAGDDDSSDTTTTTAAPAATTAPTTVAPTTTTAPTTTVALVVEGATVIVANSSIVGGAAGRMTDELATAGFTTVTATNGVEKLEATVVYYTDDDGAEAVAESVAAAMGGVEVEAMPDPIPTEDGELGDAQVLVLLGNNEADQTLEQLSGSEEEVETNGSIVVVANASGVSGSAAAMTRNLSRAGFEVGEPANAPAQLADSIVYYTDTAGAMEDAELLGQTMGAIEVEPMPDPIPTEDGELAADILLLLGTNEAGKSLAALNP